MPWVRLDEEFPDHPKVVAAGPLAGWLHVCALAYCNRYLTDGFVPSAQLAKLTDFGEMRAKPVDLAERLVEAGMWMRAKGGYLIHDFTDYQPSKAQVEAERKAKSEGGRRGATSRWHGKVMAEPMAEPMAYAMAPPMASAWHSNGLAMAYPMASGMAERCPVPVPVPVGDKSQSSSDLQGAENEAVDDDDDRIWLDLAKGDLALAQARGEVIKMPAAYMRSVASDRRRRNDRQPQAPPKPAKEDPLERTAAAAAVRRRNQEAESEPPGPEWTADPEVKALHTNGIRGTKELLKRVAE